MSPAKKIKPAKKNKGGRPSKYKKEYCVDIIKYFSGKPYKTTKGVKTANDLPLVANYAKKIGVNKDTLHEWRKVHPEFSVAYKKARELQEAFWKTNSLHGLYAPAFTIFAGKNMFGFTDTKKVDVTADVKHKHELSPSMKSALDAIYNPPKGS